MNEEVGICVLTQMALLKVPGTLYFACLPPLDLQNSIILRAAIVINNEGGLGGD
jgi:hypothetical protein